MTDTQEIIGDSYTPLLSTSTRRQNEALQHAKYISCGDGFDQDNFPPVLSTSTTCSLLATLLCTNIFDQDAKHNTYNHVLTLHESVHDLASKRIFLKGKIFFLVLDASLSPAETIIWDYRPILQKFIRYLDNISYIDTYKPFIHDNNNIFSSTPLTQAKFNNTTSIRIITIDTSKTYSYQPPPWSPKDPATTRLRVDILKKLLNDGKLPTISSTNHSKANCMKRLQLPPQRRIFKEQLSTNALPPYPITPKVTKTTSTSVST